MPLFSSRVEEIFKKSIVKYAIVGAGGTILDVGIFTLITLHPLFGGSFPGRSFAATISFLFAVTHNYILNARWTFSHTSTTSHAKKKFLTVSLGGLCLNIGILTLLGMLFAENSHPSALFQSTTKLCATLGVFLFNFTLNTHWTFRSPKTL